MYYMEELERKVHPDRIKSIEDRLEMLESDTEGLKSRFKLLDRLPSQIKAIQQDVNDLAYDLNNKMATIRGSIAANARFNKPRTQQLTAAVELEPEEEALLDQFGIQGRDREEFYKAKVLLDRVRGVKVQKSGEQAERSTPEELPKG